MRIFIVFFLLFFTLCCSHKKDCKDIEGTISSEQNAIDSIFVQEIRNKEIEIRKIILFNNISFEEKTKILKKRRDSLFYKSYQELKNNRTFKEKGLYGYISNIGKNILLYNRKYKELDSLLLNNVCFNTFEDEILKKQVFYLAYKEENQKKAYGAILSADKMIQEKLPQKIREDNINDIKFYYYFISNRTIAYGKRVGLSTVDSLVTKHKELIKYKKDMIEICNSMEEYMQLE